MGSEESKAERESSEGSSEEDSLMTCPDCYSGEEESLATYRCRLELENIGEIHNYPKLLPYWNPPHRIEGGLYHILYVACETCVPVCLESVFTHYPEGWTEKSNEKSMYELANLDAY